MKKSTLGLLIIVGLWLGLAGTLQASTLGDLATQTQPGTWKDITSSVNGFVGSGTTILATNGGHINEYSDKGVWNPIAREAMFIGISHTGGSLQKKHVKYSDSTNTWSVISAADTGQPAHSYQFNAMDPTNGDFYFFNPNIAKRVDRYRGGVWTALPPIPQASYQVAPALEFFRERNGLVFVDGDWGVWFYSVATNSWTRIAETNGNQGTSLPKLPMGSYHVVAVYNPIHKITLVGGGNGSANLYRIDQNGTITTETTAPTAVAVNSTIFTVDPISGDYLLFGNNRVFWKYSPVTKVWTQLASTQNPPFFTTSGDGPALGTVAFPIPTYGVVMFTTWAHSNSKVYLYKHAAGGGSPPSPPPAPDTTPPTISAVITSNLTSSGGTITWTTNEPADSQVEYGLTTSYGLQTTINTTLLTSHPQTISGLTSGTLYHFRVKSRDAGGNLATSADFTFTTTVSTAPPPGSTFSQKCSQPGVVNCFDFDNDSKLFYVWSPGTACDNVPYLQSKGNNSLGSNRSGPGNTAAAVQNGQCVYPQIDTSVKRSGGGALKFTIPSQSDANSSGYFAEVFKRNTNGTFAYVGPGSPLGNVVYWQFYQRFDPNFLNTNYQCGTGGSETCGGWKQIIWYGNPPNGSSASSIEVTHNNGWLRGIPTMYGQIGLDDYGSQDVRGCYYNFNGQRTYPEPPCIRFKADQWMEFTVRVEVRGAANAPQSRVQLWVNGQLAIDYQQAKINWGSSDGDGLGQFQITPYHTRKYSGQVHPIGYTWYDDVIVSTQPIPMTSGAPPTDNTPPAPPTNLSAN